MKSKIRRMWSWVAVIILIFSIVGCGSVKTDSTASKNSSDQTYSLKFGHILARDSAANVGAQKFVDLVKSRTNDKVQIELYPGGELGNEREMLEQIKLGTLDMGLIAAGQIANFQPETGIFNLPYIFRDYNHVYKVLDGEVGQEISKLLEEKQNLQCLGYFTQAFRVMLTTDRQVKTLADFKGLKIRTPEAPIFIQTFSKLGANPTPVSFTEAYTALQTDVVEGIESPAETLFLGKMNEVTKYFHKTRHLFEPMLLVVNKSIYDKLPSDVKDILQAAAQEAVPFERKLVEERDNDYINKIIQSGVKEVSIDVDSLRLAVEPMYNDYKAKVSKPELIDKVISMK